MGAEEPSTLREATGTEARYSLDELAAASDVPARTIRFYRSHGLVDPPHRRGRTVVYDDTHLARVRLIAALRGRGFGLDAIARIIDDPSAEGRSLTALLDFSQRLRQPWVDDRSATMSSVDIGELSGATDDHFLALLCDAGVVDRLGGTPATYHVPSVAVLELLGDLVAAGLDADVVVRMWRVLGEHLGPLATALIAELTSSATEEQRRSYTWDELMATYAELRTVAMRAVQLGFGQAVERAIADFVEHGGVLDLRVRSSPRPAGTPRRRRNDRRT